MKLSLAGSLLIVDDREDIRRAMHRYFRLYFETVYLASNPVEAERILRQFQPTYLLCDYWLGDEFLPSTEYIPAWRKLAPSLKCVILMTGTKVSALENTDCLDAIFQKPLEPAEVLRLFERTPSSALDDTPDSKR